MEYVINRGPRYGERIHLPASQEVHLAELLGDIVPAPLQQPATDPLKPIWGIHWNAARQPSIAYSVAGQTHFYSGPAKDAANGFKRKAWDGKVSDYTMQGPDVPQHIVDEYALYKGDDK